MKLKRILSTLLITTIMISSASWAEAKVVNRGNPDFKEIALTFDDGYSIEKINQIKNKLNQYNVKGTFFFVGSFMANNKSIVRELEADGHMVVSHSFSHKNFTKISPETMVGEIENTKIAYNKATDKKMLPYFRPPYGGYNDQVLKTLGKNHDLYVVMWTIDTRDWENRSADAIANSVLNNAQNGSIVLMHTTKHVNTDKALDRMIVGLQEQGYSLVRIDEMFIKLPEEQRLKNIDQMFYEQNSAAQPTDNLEGQNDQAPLPSEIENESAGEGEVDENNATQEEKAETSFLDQKINFINKYLWRLILSR